MYWSEICLYMIYVRIHTCSWTPNNGNRIQNTIRPFSMKRLCINYYSHCIICSMKKRLIYFSWKVVCWEPFCFEILCYKTPITNFLWSYCDDSPISHLLTVILQFHHDSGNKPDFFVLSNVYAFVNWLVVSIMQILLICFVF